MSIENFFGKTVKLLWNDVPYVGTLLLVDKGNNAVISDCRKFSNLEYQVGSYRYTINQLLNIAKLPINGISWIGESDNTTNDTNLLPEKEDAAKYYIVHCPKCIRPAAVRLCKQATRAKFIIIGGVLQDAIPMNDHKHLKSFLDKLPLNCDACSGVTIPMDLIVKV